MAGTANTRLQIMPNTPVSTFRVTPGFAELIVGTDLAVTPGALISHDLAAEIHATESATFESAIGPITFDEIYEYPSDGRLASLQNAILIVDDEGATFDACWYEVWPFTETAAGIGIMTAEDPSVSKQSQLNSRNGIEFDLTAEVEGLKVWLLTCATLVVSGAMGWIATRSRRSELASALHSTVARSDLSIIIALETLIWTLPASMLAIGASTLATSLLPPGPVPISPASVGLVSAAVAGAVSGALLATLSVRSHRLFAYLRDRR